jgi:hypothetical protein
MTALLWNSRGFTAPDSGTKPPCGRARVIRCIASSVALLLAFSVRLAAQTTDVPDPVPRVASDDASSGYETLPIGGIRRGAPLGWSAYAGVALRAAVPAGTPRFGYSGYSAVGEVGQAGARVSVGRTYAGDGGTLRLQLGALRTWQERGSVLANQTYLGPEALCTLFIVGASVGSYWRARGTEDSPGHFFSVNLVVGL